MKEHGGGTCGAGEPDDGQHETYRLVKRCGECAVLEAGETKSITWHFTAAGELEFACHQPGHYAGGMTGTFEVS